MFKKFLVPVDGSPSSKFAYRKAVELAKLTGAEIVLMQIALDMDYYSRKGVLFAKNYYNESEMRRNGAAILNDVRSGVDEGDLQIKELIVLGDPARKIISETKNNPYDLIIMGSRGNGPFKGAVLGSVSQRVLIGGKCPVLIVKDPYEKISPDDVNVSWS